MSLRRNMMVVPLILLGGLGGCGHACKKRAACATCQPGFGSPGALQIGQPIPIGPPSGSPFIGSPGAGAAPLPPQGVPPSSFYRPSPPAPLPLPSQRAPEILLPQSRPVPIVPPTKPVPTSPGPYIGGLFIGDPVPTEPLVRAPISPLKERTAFSSPLNNIPPPPADLTQESSPTLPVGIPDFNPVKDGVAAGLRPDADGFEWLQTNRYRGIVFLRRPSEDDAADRKLVESKGMKFHSVTVGADGITKSSMEQFNQIVAAPENGPMFVYDLTGTLAGSMWYTHFRTADNATDEVARERAGRLGLSEQGNDEQVKLWLSIQKLLEKPRD